MNIFSNFNSLANKFILKKTSYQKNSILIHINNSIWNLISFVFVSYSNKSECKLPAFNFTFNDICIALQHSKSSHQNFSLFFYFTRRRMKKKKTKTPENYMTMKINAKTGKVFKKKRKHKKNIFFYKIIWNRNDEKNAIAP